MKVKTISFTRLFNKGNFSHDKIGIEIELDGNEDPHKVLKQAKSFVEYHNPNLGYEEKINQLKEIINDPGQFTGNQIAQASAELDRIESMKKSFSGN